MLLEFTGTALRHTAAETDRVMHTHTHNHYIPLRHLFNEVVSHYNHAYSAGYG